jgi:N-acetylglucosamine-6-phosphate deacetylase
MCARASWLAQGTLITPRGVVNGAVGIRNGRIAAIERHAPRGERAIDVGGRCVSPGLIDLHIWGDPQRVSAQEARSGTTAFLTAIGPEPPERLANRLVQLHASQPWPGAKCLGMHLEGPFLNPLRAGALASRWLRPPMSRELRHLLRSADGGLKLMTIAPEIPRGLEAIRWCARHHIVVSLGHSDASAELTQRAVNAGARAATHVYNGMRPLHHRDPGLLGEVLTDDRLMAMVILDGVHVDPVAFQLLWRCKGPGGIVLVTDSIRHQVRLHATHASRQASRRVSTAGAFSPPSGVLAGSRLTMIRAVKNAGDFGKITLLEAIHMASLNAARLLGIERECGSLEVGKRADLVVFDQRFRVQLTMVGGQIVYHRRD